MINLLPIVYIMAGCGGFVAFVALSLNVVVDYWPREPKLSKVWRHKPLEEWDSER